MIDKVILEDLERLATAASQSVKFYTAMRDFLLELKALDDPEVNKLFEKYEVVVE